MFKTKQKQKQQNFVFSSVATIVLLFVKFQTSCHIIFITDRNRVLIFVSTNTVIGQKG